MLLGQTTESRCCFGREVTLMSTNANQLTQSMFNNMSTEKTENAVLKLNDFMVKMSVLINNYKLNEFA